MLKQILLKYKNNIKITLRIKIKLFNNNLKIKKPPIIKMDHIFLKIISLTKALKKIIVVLILIEMVALAILMKKVMIF
jgi:hypothetical protein